MILMLKVFYVWSPLRLDSSKNVSFSSEKREDFKTKTKNYEFPIETRKIWIHVEFINNLA